MTEEEQTFTTKDVAEMLERQQYIYALDHAIQRGKREGDSVELVNPLVMLYNQIKFPPKPAPKKEEEAASEEE